MDKEPTQEPSPFDNPIYRREAGEGWHPGGLNRRVLGAIVVRELISAEISEVRDEEREMLLFEYQDLSDHVDKLKRQSGIGEAPPRPIE